MNRRSKLIGRQLIITAWVMLLLCVAPISAFASPNKATAAEDVTVKLNGQKVKLADPVLIQDNQTFVPLARIAVLLDASVKWDGDNEEITVKTAVGDTIVFGNGVPVVYFNEKRYVLDAPPFMSDGRMYIPLRQGAELFHAKIKWNGEERSAEIEEIPLAVVTEEFGLAEMSKEYGAKQSELRQRNGLAGGDSVEAGAKLKVVVPSIFDKEAKPFTDKDLQLLAKITQVEAGYEPYEGQLAVANVILNRVKDSRFPDTIRDVIYAGKQFPPAHNGLLDKSVPNQSVLRAAKDALNGKNNVEDAVYFFNPKVSKGPFWSGLDVIVTIGHHSFAK